MDYDTIIVGGGPAGLSAALLLLATRVVDEVPAIPGLADLHGVSVFTCPDCDGWEVRGSPLAVHAAGGAALAEGTVAARAIHEEPWAREPGE